MTEFNASLLGSGGGNLGQLALMAQQQRQQTQQNLLSQLANSAKDIKSGFAQNDLENVLQKNFNPETQQLNQQGVIADLFKVQPQAAMALSQQFKQQEMQGLKTQGEYAKSMAEAGKIGAETQKLGFEANKVQADTSTVELENHSKGLTQLTTMINAIDNNSPNAQAQYEKSIAYAQKNRIPGWELFAGQQFSPELKNRALGMLIDGKSQIELMIQQQNANTQATKASNDYELGQQKNMIDKEGNLIQIRGQDIQAQNAANNLAAEQAKANRISPELEFKQQEKADQKLEKYTEAKNNLLSANRGIEDIKNKAMQLKDSPLISDSTLSLNAGNAVPGMGTKSKEYKALYDNFFNSVVGSTLQNIRAQSVTGASGYGQVTEKELPIIGAGGGAKPWEQFVNLTPVERATYLKEFVNKADESVKLNRNLIMTNENKIRKNSSPDTVVHTSSKGVALTKEQYDAIKRAKEISSN